MPDVADSLLTTLGRATGAARSRGIPVIYVRVAFRPGTADVSPRNKAFAAIAASAPLLFDDPVTQIRCRIYDLPLPRGRYSVWLHLDDERDDDVIPWHPVASFILAGSDLDPAPKGVVRLAPVHVRAEWERSTP